ncbi:hypothetical protein BAU15_12955 [Enterococcus sp. JM4C]|uniref:aminotransferase-like domain-containing protein n=1 Tax=Candidatus Enterococcus huntleyi TaxID=1857217 RepID=UPI00137AC67B|nr:PLP-dependent aminotransferase family protein [Enterococcus sp. JM4C]KAF1297670.1 hypothetical protein BAU15_12955 [Enterococcus sp. JM4C]
MWDRIRKNEQADKAAYIQIMEQITERIKKGVLNGGEQLPSERKLADLFGVNRSTVVRSLEELTSLGVLVRKQGSGTFVNEEKWGVYAEPRIDWRNYLSQNLLFKDDSFVNEFTERKKQKQLIDVFSGELPTALIPSFEFPTFSWSEILSEETKQDELGYLPLRIAIGQLISEIYEQSVSPRETLITAGGQQGMFLILQTMLSAGEAVAVEDPSFFYQLPMFQAAGVRLYGVPMDEEGIQIEALEEMILAKKIKMVMVNPNFQNPTGIVMSLDRRKALIALCRNYQIPIVEDDVFAELSYNKPTLPTLKKLDPDNVLYIGSFSKILGNTTRIGWVCAPSHVLDSLVQARKTMDFSVSIIPQVLAYWALSDESYPDKLKQLGVKLQQQAQHFQEWLDGQTFWQGQAPQGGYYSWLTWQGKSLTKPLAKQMLQLGIAAGPAYLYGSKENGLRINVSRIHQQNFKQFTEKMDELEQLLKDE